MSGARPPVLLLHGGWGGAWCWSAVTPALVRAGHPVLAPDLPGAGLEAREPRSSSKQDSSALSEERSPLADLSLEEYASPVVAQLAGLHEAWGPAVVVGHSISGVLLHYLGERVPELIDRLVYLAAVGPGRGRSVSMDTVEEPWSASLFASLLVADPGTVGALRINPASGDAGYLDSMRRCWFADVAPEVAAVATRMLSTENPAILLSEPSVLTDARWGSIPRSWIRTTQDASIPTSGQDVNIAELDASFPNQRFDVLSLDSGHMPMLSVPDALARLIRDVAAPTVQPR